MLKRLIHNPLTLIFHCALMLMLMGAFVTHFQGDSAMLSLRVGETSNMAVREDARIVNLPFSVKLNDFSVETYEDGKTHKNYLSRVTIRQYSRSVGEEGKEYDAEVEMNRPLQISPVFGLGFLGAEYSLLQMSYDSDLKGSTLLVQHDPWGVCITFCGYYLLLAACLLMLLRHSFLRHRSKIYWLCMGIAAIGASGYVVSKLFSTSVPLMPVLRSPYLVVHVSIIIMAYMLMICMVFTSLRALSGKADAAKGKGGEELLLPAVVLLAAGIFIGAIWANDSWGRYWGWDPKETWALITLIVYSLPLHRHSLKIFRNQRVYHIYIILAFLSVVITYFGVNYLLGGLHSYA